MEQDINGSTVTGDGNTEVEEIAAAAEPDAVADPLETLEAEIATPDSQEPSHEYVASFRPGPDKPLPEPFADACKRIQTELGLPLWLLVHAKADQDDPLALLGPEIRNSFFAARQRLAACQRAALIVDSSGGFADDAYEIARLFQRHCGGFLPVVPRYAKSAGTLLVLGGPLLMAADAQLGPLDAQIYDYEREELLSALNEVQALERLHLQAVEDVDQMVPLLVSRTRKKVSTILPLVLDFVANMKRPLLEKLDTVHYTAQSRVLKEAEDYAVRLLQHSGLYSNDETTSVPGRLVNRYPDHSFVIDREEAGEFLQLMEPPSEEFTNALEDLADYLTNNRLVAIGSFDAKDAD